MSQLGSLGDQLPLLTAFGEHPEIPDWLLVHLNDRYAGTYILGVQGYGKSGLLQNLINRDMQAGHAVIVIDPHGDLAQNCLGLVPDDRLHQTFLLDMEDEEFPFGVNVFSTGKLATSMDRAWRVEQIMHIFEVLWPEVATQQYLQMFLPNTIQVFLDNPGKTLADMLRFFHDDAFRSSMLKNVTNQDMLDFWAREYDRRSDTERRQRVQPLTNRLNILFTGNSLVRNILGQAESKINFRQAIEEKQIICIKLPTTRIPHVARLIGTILLAQIHDALFSFADTSVVNRPGVSLFMDEFQNFATKDIGQLFTEGRKFGMRLTIAHQQRDQLPGFLQSDTMTARTIVCFRLTPDDSREMAHAFPSNEATILPEDIEVHPSRYLLNHPLDNQDGMWLFTEFYLHPLQGYKRGAGSVEVERWKIGGPQLDAMITGDYTNPRVADPTHRLDSLLYEVMRTGNPDLPIPPEVVEGFSNCGIGFYKEARRLGYNDRLLQAHAVEEMPRHLVGRDAEGWLYWMREPETGKEQMLHFIFYLRCVMQQLAQNPIGKATTVSPAETAKKLTSLPNREAFVRSADTVGRITTLDNIPASYLPIDQNTREVRAHTRARYCTPRAEVERRLQGLPDEPPEENGGVPAEKPPKQPPDQPMGRWEEVA